MLEELPVHALQGRRSRPSIRAAGSRRSATRSAASRSSRSCRQVTRVDAPALGEQDPVPLAVALEGLSRAVRPPPVELDDQPLAPPRGSRPRRSGRARRSAFSRGRGRPCASSSAQERAPRTRCAVIPDRLLDRQQRPQDRGPAPPGWRSSRSGSESRSVSRRTSASFSARSSCRFVEIAARSNSVRDTEVTGIPSHPSRSRPPAADRSGATMPGRC